MRWPVMRFTIGFVPRVIPVQCGPIFRIGRCERTNRRRSAMLREQMINFLEAIVVFLLLTNALSAGAAIYAMWIASGFADRKRELIDLAERKLGAKVRRQA